MTRVAAALLAEALRLDERSRADLAAELVASLDGPADADATSSCQHEIEQRVAAFGSGTVQAEPWDKVRRRIERDVLGLS